MHKREATPREQREEWAPTPEFLKTRDFPKGGGVGEAGRGEN